MCFQNCGKFSIKQYSVLSTVGGRLRRRGPPTCCKPVVGAVTKHLSWFDSGPGLSPLTFARWPSSSGRPLTANQGPFFRHKSAYDRASKSSDRVNGRIASAGLLVDISAGRD